MNLTVILSPDATLEIMKAQGRFSRFRRNMEEYSSHFRVDLYTCDSRDFTREIGVRHHRVPFLVDAYVVRHVMFYLFLMLSSAFFRRGVIRVYGVSMPFLFVMRALSGNRTVVSYEWDYAEQAREIYGGAKGFAAPLIERITMSGTDVVFATTDRIRDKIRAKYGKEAVTMPLFLDTGMFRPGGKEEDYVFFAARLHWIKGLDVLLEAFSILRKAGIRTGLVVAGSGDARKFEAIASRLGIDGVRFLGPIENMQVGKYMRTSKCFVLPTVTMEGQPVSLIEAMASGCACVVTDVPGSSDTIKDQENGLIVPPGDPEALAGALERVITDRKLRERLGKNALGYSRRHSMENTVRKEAEYLRGLR